MMVTCRLYMVAVFAQVFLRFRWRSCGDQAELVLGNTMKADTFLETFCILWCFHLLDFAHGWKSYCHVNL